MSHDPFEKVVRPSLRSRLDERDIAAAKRDYAHICATYTGYKHTMQLRRILKVLQRCAMYAGHHPTHAKERKTR